MLRKVINESLVNPTDTGSVYICLMDKWNTYIVEYNEDESQWEIKHKDDGEVIGSRDKISDDLFLEEGITQAAINSAQFVTLSKVKELGIDTDPSKAYIIIDNR